MNAIDRLPTLYIPHGGGPCFFVDPPPSDPHMWEGLAAYLRGIDAHLGVRPKAVLVISGHWEAQQPTINIAQRHKLLFDYYGFPEHTYRLKYPVHGAPELEPRVRELLAGSPDSSWATSTASAASITACSCRSCSSTRTRTCRSCSSPCSRVSIRPCISPSVARSLLRARGVLIVGSGAGYHNLAAMFSGRGAAAAASFDAWLGETVRDVRAREERLIAWKNAPGGRESHPRAEHLLPLMVAAGAADGDPGIRAFGESIAGNAISGFQFG